VRRAKQANRRRGAVGALAVAMAAAAVIVTPHFVGDSPVSNIVTSPAPSDHLANPYTCPLPGEPAPRTSHVASGDIPLGAVLVRLCSTPGSPRWQAPLDALTTHVDKVALTFDSAPASLVDGCFGDHSMPSYTLTFQYGDGRLVRVQSQGCNGA